MTRRCHGRPTQRSVEPSHSRQRSRAHGRLLRLFRPPATEEDSISTWNLCSINKHLSRARLPVGAPRAREYQSGRATTGQHLHSSHKTPIVSNSITCALVLFLRLLDALVSFKGKALIGYPCNGYATAFIPRRTAGFGAHPSLYIVSRSKNSPCKTPKQVPFFAPMPTLIVPSSVPRMKCKIIK